MSLIVWVSIYTVASFFWAWIVFWGGDEFLEGTFASGFIHILAPRWSADGLRLFAGLSWIGFTVWFLLGVFVPALRFLR
jgi:hypothetical protein